jgi:plasmid stabilization system protein ParE
MSSRIVFRTEAQADVAAAFAWYEDQRAGLGLQFLDEIEHCLQRIAESPEACPVVYRRFRRALTSRFPYKVFYFLEADSINIVAVLHAARHPLRWRSRTRPQDN